jgi:hypothetical protein
VTILTKDLYRFIVRSEHKKVFKPERFYNYIEKHGYNEQLFEGKRADVLDLYKRFIYSVNFASWMDQRIQEAYLNDILHTDISQLLRDVSEVGMIDLFLRLKEEYELEKQGLGLTCGDTEIIKRLQLFLQQTLQCLPTSLGENLARQIEGLEIDVSNNQQKQSSPQKVSSKSSSNNGIDDYFNT